MTIIQNPDKCTYIKQNKKGSDTVSITRDAITIVKLKE